jgi:hypothetical protein
VDTLFRMSQAVAMITDRVRERVRRDGVNLGDDGVAERYIRVTPGLSTRKALSCELPEPATENSGGCVDPSLGSQEARAAGHGVKTVLTAPP